MDPATRERVRQVRAAARLAALALLGGALGGCALGYHVEAGPLADTTGRAAVAARAGFGFGFEAGDDQGVLVVGEGGLGSSIVAAEGVVVGGVGIDYLHQDLAGGDLALRVGYRGRVIGAFADEWRETLVSVGGAIAFLFPYDERRRFGHAKLGFGGRDFWNLGVALEAGALLKPAAADEGLEGALFLLSFVYAFNGFVASY